MLDQGDLNASATTASRKTNTNGTTNTDVIEIRSGSNMNALPRIGNSFNAVGTSAHGGQIDERTSESIG